MPYAKTPEFPNDTKCDCVKGSYVGRSMCLSRNCQVECEDNCYILTACANQRITKKKSKNIIWFKDINKGLGIKSNEQQIHKDESINENVGVAMSSKNINKALKDYEYETILIVMAFDIGTWLDNVNYGRETRRMNH